MRDLTDAGGPARAPCARCGVVHGPWGVHEPVDVLAAYHAWVEEDGGIESALTVAAGGDGGASRKRLVAALDRFEAGAGPGDLDQPTVTLHVGYGATTEWGPGFGPLGAPGRLLVPLSTLVERARADLRS